MNIQGSYTSRCIYIYVGVCGTKLIEFYLSILYATYGFLLCEMYSVCNMLYSACVCVCTCVCRTTTGTSSSRSSSRWPQSVSTAMTPYHYWKRERSA